jgi:hypothetical protein
VTEPDPIAAVAREVEDLRATVARYQAIVTSWNARLEREGLGGTLMLRHELKQLTQKLETEIARFGAEAQREARAEADAEIREELKRLRHKLDEAIARRQADDPPAPYLLGLPAEEQAARLAGVRAWVEQVGLVQYRGYFEKLPPCWPSHPEAVIELATVMAEWVRIYEDPDSRPLQDALVWNDKWLPGCLGRVVAAIRCDVSGCRLARTSPWERSPPPSRYT